jgi:eukaryotic-like serine/threonine-protein kinase
MDASKNPHSSPLSEQITRDYQIIKLLGKGGMGEVYLAEQLRVGRRQVALKVLNRACSEDADIVKRFANEAASAGRLQHRNVVMIFESRITDDGQLYVSMEYVSGKALREVITERGALPIEEVVEITRQICAGLQVAHQQGIVHRDIKPDNLMLARDYDGTQVVKVLDFGIARLLEPGMTSMQTKSGIIMGTPYYMSPEQALGNTGEKIDARSDIYSLAMVVYQMLTGRVAFDSDSWMQVMYKHIHEAPLPPSLLRSELSHFAEVEQVVLKGLEKTREHRQQTVLEFASQLEAAYVRAQNSSLEKAITAAYSATLRNDLTFVSTTSAVAVDLPAAKESAPVTFAPQSSKTFLSRLSKQKIRERRNVFIILALVMISTLIALLLVAWKPAPETAKSDARTPAPVVRSTALPALQTFEVDVLTVDKKGRLATPRRAQVRYFSDDLGDGVVLDMVEVVGGTYLMGTPQKMQNDRSASEGPQRQVTVPAFFIGMYEVTQAQWLTVAKLPKVNRDLPANPSAFKGDNRLPVQNVTWWEAVEFCERLSRAAGRTYRLPSEAEWEYACRAGTTTPFYFGETMTADMVNYDANYPYGEGPRGITRQHPTPVGNLGGANAFGLYNMHGDMSEWCLDPWHENYTGAPSDGSSWEAGGNLEFRVLRGGSWFSGGDDCRSAVRHKYPPDITLSVVGFRVVMVAPSR